MALVPCKPFQSNDPHGPIPHLALLADQVTGRVDPHAEEPFHSPGPVKKNGDLQRLLLQKPPNHFRVLFAVDSVKH